MNILITGGNGFIGRKLLFALLERGKMVDAEQREREIERIVISDIGPGLRPLPDDPRIEERIGPGKGDIGDPDVAARLAKSSPDLVFHLAAVVSGEAESDFDLGMRINFHGSLRLLESFRASGKKPRLVFAGSVASYGGEMPETIPDSAILTPQTSYGSQKAAIELILHDYSRRGFLDGRALRLPTVVVRPGKANAAASSFASAIIREPLEGRPYTCPVSRETRVWLLSPRQAVKNLLHAASLPAGAFGMNRSLNLPGMTLSVAEMIDELRAVAGREVGDRLSFHVDPFIERIVSGWATAFSPERALKMGFSPDPDFRSVIEAFIADDLGGQSPS
ncbi:MAG: NAD-dependent epimerase/dehydratase family protein [Ectothiorhodospiraceae bacterium AqS1]|nr:NAD-dependent epimerase/dehydratase family protein [Ectothiorhodospiraceae bacterium AqS1]